MEFLRKVFYGNELWLWALGLALTVAAFILFMVLKGIAARRLTRFAKSTQTDIDDLVADLLHKTSFVAMLVLALYVGTMVLTLHPAASRILRIIAVMALLLQGALWGSGIITFWITRYAKEKMEEDAAAVTTVKSVGFLLRLALWSVITLLALDNLGFEISALLAGLGIGGIAVALAAQNILGDLFASLSIVLDKPFVIGDFIIVGEQMGTVEHIGMKTTRIRSLFGEQIIMSNTDLLKSRIRNYKRMAQRRALFSVGVTYATPADKLERIPEMLKEIVSSHEHTRLDRSHFKELGDSALIFEVVYYMEVPDYAVFMDTQQSINLAIFRKFEQEGIEFAYPTRTIHMAAPATAGAKPTLPRAGLATS
jgi:small-conductance mechanosensitive channel